LGEVPTFWDSSRQSKVTELRNSASRATKQDVVRLQVTVHDPKAMYVNKSKQQLIHNPQQIHLCWPRPKFLQHHHGLLASFHDEEAQPAAHEAAVKPHAVFVPTY